MTALEPRYAHSEVRQNRNRLIEAGFVFAGERSDGHFDFIHPSGETFSLSGTPRGGQTTIVKDVCRKVAGIGQRGGFDREAQRERLSRARAQRDRELQAAARKRDDIAERRNAERRATARESELRAIAHLMGSGSYSARLI